MKTNEDVIIAFLNGKTAKNHNMESINGKLYSYRTVIASYNDKGELWVNDTKYSVSTTRQQSILNRQISKMGKEVKGRRDNISMGCSDRLDVATSRRYMDAWGRWMLC